MSSWLLALLASSQVPYELLALVSLSDFQLLFVVFSSFLFLSHSTILNLYSGL